MFRHLRRGPWKSKRGINPLRSEEHTSELQSQSNLVCRLLLEKKNIHDLDRRLLCYGDDFELGGGDLDIAGRHEWIRVALRYPAHRTPPTDRIVRSPTRCRLVC